MSDCLGKWHGITNSCCVAITSFEEAKKSDIENERLPPTREMKEAMLKEETDSKLRDAVQEEDKKLNEVAEAIMSDAD